MVVDPSVQHSIRQLRVAVISFLIGTKWLTVTCRFVCASLIIETSDRSESLPISMTARLTIGEIAVCSVRGRMTRCTCRRQSSFASTFVLIRLCGTDRTFEWTTLVTQVFEPSDSVTMLTSTLGRMTLRCGRLKHRKQSRVSRGAEWTMLIQVMVGVCS